MKGISLMEHQQEISQLIAHLENHVLVQAPSEIWQDRQSGILRVRATFDNDKSLIVDISDRETILEIKALFQANLKRVFAQTSDFRDLLKLETAQRYTVLVDSEMGLGVCSVQMTL